MVLPFYHSGMGYVLPMDAKMFSAGQQVTIVVGEPLDLSDVTCRCNAPGADQRAVWSELTARVRGAVLELEKRAPPNPNQPEPPGANAS